MSFFKSILFFLIIVPALTHAQEWCETYPEKVKQRLHETIAVLSHDTLKGREAGTNEDIMAARYIAGIFEETGLAPIMPDSSFFQSFNFINGISLSYNNTMKLNRRRLTLMDDFYPLNMSANGRANGEIVKLGYGIKSERFGYNDFENISSLEGKVFVVKTGLPQALRNREETEHLGSKDFKISIAERLGAVAIIFINPTSNDDKEPQLYTWHYRQAVNIPVLFAKGHALKMIMDATSLQAQIEVDIEKEVRISYNVIGYLDNSATHTIVIGGHYDHLGMGSPISRHTGPPAIHPGADDNASGVAATIELARRFVCQDFNNYNILFIAFGAEEKGLLGSHFFVNSDDYDVSRINYMLNLDMIGRIDKDERELSLIGTGSSPLWDSIIRVTPEQYFRISKTASASGGSDHINFYLNDIPILFFFSGFHQDYHKPADVIDKINFEGLRYVVDYAEQLVHNTDTLYIPFSQAPVQKRERSVRRSATVALGIMPDHAYEDIGLRIADVNSEGPAKKAGLMRGDIILKIASFDIRDIYGYMSALNHLEAGEKVIVQVQRQNEVIEINVQL